eukprot:360631-Chlamydomonas_euryale.AAC.1
MCGRRGKACVEQARVTAADEGDCGSAGKGRVQGGASPVVQAGVMEMAECRGERRQWCRRE